MLARHGLLSLLDFSIVVCSHSHLTACRYLPVLSGQWSLTGVLIHLCRRRVARRITRRMIYRTKLGLCYMILCFGHIKSSFSLQAESLMACPHGSTVALATPESTSCNHVATYEVVLARWSVDMLRPCVMGCGGEF